MSELIFSIISQGLILINKEVPDAVLRIQQRLNDYKEQWDAEMAKADGRDDSKLDFLDSELLYTGQLYLAAIKQATPPSQP
jgi:hypothetical protein